MHFEELQLIDPLLKAVHAHGYTVPTPIQEKAIPHVLAGRDLMGCAQTGTGKTAAFALPILQRLYNTPRGRGHRPIRTLILTPTRELAAQVAESFNIYGAGTGLKHTVIYGGVGQSPQTRALSAGVDILVATPGRLLDLMNQGFVHLDAVEVLVLDEADRMLDMGFINDIRRIVKALPVKRQTLLFSATLAPDIRQLAGNILTDPVSISVAPPATTIEAINQMVCYVEKPRKLELLVHVLQQKDLSRALVFSRTKHGADRIVRYLEHARITAVAIHGNKSQSNRERALESFKRGHSRVMVATDIAARGLDIHDVSHVINFDLPNEPEAYVHRIGRTGRAGATGCAISFCCFDEGPLLTAIERLIRKRLPVSQDHPHCLPPPVATADTGANRTRSLGGSRGSGVRSFNPRNVRRTSSSSARMGV